jgi:hypothetical protein
MSIIWYSVSLVTYVSESTGLLPRWLTFAGVVAVHKLTLEGSELLVNDGEVDSMIFSKIRARNGMA